ncbi:hypothetical protein PVK06_013872 [Gossypium arboreum]|uniref:Uncharacterized protein n=1 Tax=Gossypium arboreum TaxID=29729 RepID=A0ABR0PTS0_GOSAR|nr:hypothetical protein PVK06_013872 [Gossypium arboreum]
MMTLGGGKEDLKSLEIELPGNVAGKLNVLLTDSDDGSEFSYEGSVEEEKLEEIMQELYKEIASTSPPPSVTFPSLSSSSSSSSSLTFSPISDVKISESCGASMSDSSSTVMAGIAFVGPTGKFPDVKEGSPEKELWIKGMERCDEEEGEVGDDPWLARVLGWGPLELEEWT